MSTIMLYRFGGEPERGAKAMKFGPDKIACERKIFPVAETDDAVARGWLRVATLLELIERAQAPDDEPLNDEQGGNQSEGESSGEAGAEDGKESDGRGDETEDAADFPRDDREALKAWVKARPDLDGKVDLRKGLDDLVADVEAQLNANGH